MLSLELRIRYTVILQGRRVGKEGRERRAGKGEMGREGEGTGGKTPLIYIYFAEKKKKMQVDSVKLKVMFFTINMKRVCVFQIVQIIRY